MDKFEQLDFRLGPELQGHGNILDRLDYQLVRRLGVQLRNVPRPDQDWDLPPASLQGWISSYSATIKILRLAQSSGLLQLLKDNTDEIRDSLSPGMVPALDAEIVDRKTLDHLIASAKAEDHFKKLDFERFLSAAPTREEIAKEMVVELNVSVRWRERPKVDEKIGLKRLQIGALIGQVALGGALAAGNLALGVIGGIITSIPAITLATIPVTLALVGSTYTGFAAALGGVEKLAVALRG